MEALPGPWEARMRFYGIFLVAVATAALAWAAGCSSTDTPSNGVEPDGGSHVSTDGGWTADARAHDANLLRDADRVDGSLTPDDPEDAATPDDPEDAGALDGSTTPDDPEDATTPDDPEDAGGLDGSQPPDPEDAGAVDAGGGDDTDAGPTCPGRTGAAGFTERTVMVNGTTRTYRLYVPEGLDPQKPAPLVSVHHGYTMTGQAMYDLTSFAEIANQEGAVVAYPYGTGWPGFLSWNAGDDLCGAGNSLTRTADDIAFVEAMIDDIDADHCVAREEVYVTGFSMGGYFSNHIACQRPDLVRAVGPHSGGTYGGDCAAGIVPVMIMHGTDDGLITVSCGIQARDLWVARNGCSTEFDTVPILGGHCEWHRDCPEGGQVTLCLLDGMGHVWSGGEGTYGSGPGYEDAAWLLWDFFRGQH
jgi:polyhydroxybutyrate depolymerase